MWYNKHQFFLLISVWFIFVRTLVENPQFSGFLPRYFRWFLSYPIANSDRYTTRKRSMNINNKETQTTFGHWISTFNLLWIIVFMCLSMGSISMNILYSSCLLHVAGDFFPGRILYISLSFCFPDFCFKYILSSWSVLKKKWSTCTQQLN